MTTAKTHHPITAPHYVRTSDLIRRGLSWRDIREAVRVGTLIRLRDGVYVDADCETACAAAVRVRARLACVSELRRLGVFVRDRHDCHVHVDATASRLPSAPSGWRVHRRRLLRAPHPRAMSVDVFDALFDAVLCQDPRAAVATIDSALHRGVLHPDDLDALFAALPRRHRRLRGLLDARSESGPETLVRLMLRGLGASYDLQVEIDRVGRVDFLVDGWLIVECDSREFHSDWAAQKEDRRRDLAAARRGFCTIRFTAEDIMWRPEIVLDALRGLLAGAAARGRVAVAG